jgi:hypothetical protein
MLTSKFPNVQFIVTAHSPVIVAGCDKGEVSVLRKRAATGAFYIDTLARDFLGATAQDLYRQVFEIDESDRLYLEYATKGMFGERERSAEIARLEEKNMRTPQEETRLNELHRDSRLVGRAEEVREKRLQSEGDDARISSLESEIEELKHRLSQREREIDGMKASTSQSS